MRGIVPSCIPQDQILFEKSRGYILSDEIGAEILLVATGSEVPLVLSVITKLRHQGRKVRAVST